MKKLMLLCCIVLGGCMAGDDDGDDTAAIDASIPDCIHPDTPDPDPAPCATCGADQICVQRFDGTCGVIGFECQVRAPTCNGLECGTCDIPHCREDPNGPITFTCAAAPCGTEVPGALHCYGP